MTWRLFGRGGSRDERTGSYFVTFRMQTGAGRLEAKSQPELSQLLGELRLAGASDITVVDAQGRLVSFDPGS
ncbi:hypothetical protein [Devosia sp.]|uniref:hypothetical protein n=1 Tax=Devosia sp. TaxID=1871048 RepID=UPI003F72221F